MGKSVNNSVCSPLPFNLKTTWFMIDMLVGISIVYFVVYLNLYIECVLHLKLHSKSIQTNKFIFTPNRIWIEEIVTNEQRTVNKFPQMNKAGISVHVWYEGVEIFTGSILIFFGLRNQTHYGPCVDSTHHIHTHTHVYTHQCVHANWAQIYTQTCTLWSPSESQFAEDVRKLIKYLLTTEIIKMEARENKNKIQWNEIIISWSYIKKGNVNVSTKRYERKKKKTHVVETRTKRKIKIFHQQTFEFIQ